MIVAALEVAANLTFLLIFKIFLFAKHLEKLNYPSPSAPSFIRDSADDLRKKW